ncbi:unnamed protein product [Ceratitis capitata]|uniref:(Mediterranean fruit fly) hypothetical protein n=1 Tax=Ceratitis capitata TaxID=7213 RepID=A0A811VI93_CERCA|nr:unnamed protein product [Ceratitis capitata]
MCFSDTHTITYNVGPSSSLMQSSSREIAGFNSKAHGFLCTNMKNIFVCSGGVFACAHFLPVWLTCCNIPWHVLVYESMACRLCEILKISNTFCNVQLVFIQIW